MARLCAKGKDMIDHACCRMHDVLQVFSWTTYLYLLMNAMECYEGSSQSTQTSYKFEESQFASIYLIVIFLMINCIYFWKKLKMSIFIIEY